MSKRSNLERIQDILNAIDSIDEILLNQTEQDFVSSIVLQSAIQFQFLIIGEAVSGVDFHILKQYEYPWHLPRSFRNFIIHEYHEVDIRKVYHTKDSLPQLRTICNSIQSDLTAK
jgi:uncharacterized protein with HEPN domain